MTDESPTERQPLKQLNIRLPDDLHHALKKRCIDDRIPIAKAVERLACGYVDGTVDLPEEEPERTDIGTDVQKLGGGGGGGV